MPVGLISSGNLYYVHPDHLGSPRTITDSSNNVLWTWANDSPSGDNLPTETGISTYNLRFPGQYFDNETKLNYNLNRDYNSNTGRYVQTDPIGLNGGLNLYNYAAANPLINFDSSGLYFGGWSLQEKGAGFFVNASFASEFQVKKNFALQDDSAIYLLAHASSRYFGGYTGNDLAKQLENGLLLTGGNNTKTTYLQDMIRQHKNIEIILDGCNAGSPNWQKNSQLNIMELNQNVAESMGKELRDFLNSQNANDLSIDIYAPSGYASWIGFDNPLMDYVSKENVVTNKGSIDTNGSWEHFKF